MTNNRTSDDVVIERTFDAPVSLIWQLWTDPAHFAAWYGPDGAIVSVADMDVRVGGARRICMEMQTPAGPMRMWFTGEYRDVVENVRLVYTDSITDEDGNISAAPGHPETTEVRVELEDLGGHTRMVMTHVGVPSGSPGATGWAVAFEKLEARAALR